MITNTLCWEQVAGMMDHTAHTAPCPLGMLVPDAEDNCDHVAVVYDRGQTPPHITVQEIASSVHKVMADGVAVAVVARASGPALMAQDVLLVERAI